MKDKIIEIIGHGMESERAECKAKEITALFKDWYPKEFIRWLSVCIANNEILLGLPQLYRIDDTEYDLPDLYQYWIDEIKDK